MSRALWLTGYLAMVLVALVTDVVFNPATWVWFAVLTGVQIAALLLYVRFVPRSWK